MQNNYVQGTLKGKHAGFNLAHDLITEVNTASPFLLSSGNMDSAP